MFSSKIETIILAIALFVAVSPIYSLVSSSFSDNKEAANSPSSDNSLDKEIVFFEGKYYDQKKTRALEPQFNEFKGLLDQERSDLMVLINKNFNNYSANVDSFLDWFYDLKHSSINLDKAQQNSSKFLKDQLAQQLGPRPERRDIMVALDLLNSRLKLLSHQLDELTWSLADCETPASAELSAVVAASNLPTSTWPLNVTQSQAELADLEIVLKTLASDFLLLSPDSPLITGIAERSSFIVAQNILAYPPSNPNLDLLVSRPIFKQDIVESIISVRHQAMAFLQDQ
jgi:hypothetical protein